MLTEASKLPDAASGISGLDDILSGGFARQSVFLLEGSPGTGKTTMALQYLLAGAAAGERGLYVTLSETEKELRQTAASHGWLLDDQIDVFELVPPESLLDPDQEQSLLYSSDLELGEATKQIFVAVKRAAPARIVIDSLSEIRLLAQSSLRYRRQILALKHFFSRYATTVLLLDDMTAERIDKTVHSVAHGVVRLEELAPDYGAERRRIRVLKYRGRSFRGGYHDFAIRAGGAMVFPRLVSAEHRRGQQRRQVPSGIQALDKLLGGGVDSGSSMLILGPAGVGKSLVALQFVIATLAQGERGAIFMFDEEPGILIDRAAKMGLDIAALMASGQLYVEQIDAAEMSPGEFAHRVRAQIQELQVRCVVIDSLNGYQAAMPEERSLVLHVHELLQFLNRQGATTLLTVAQHGLLEGLQSPVDLTYLADTVLLLRYFEALGRVRRAVSVIKKRMGAHEDTIRELRISAEGITVGEPLTGFQSVLRGAPTYLGNEAIFEDRGA